MEKPILFLRPGSHTFLRDKQFALRIYKGAPPNDCAASLGISQAAARQVLHRIRKRAADWAGRDVSDVMVLRLMFDRDRAEADLRQVREAALTTTETAGKVVAA